jgi:hypothetical protein
MIDGQNGATASLSTAEALECLPLSADAPELMDLPEDILDNIVA